MTTRVNSWQRFIKERVPVDIEIFEELSKEPIPHHMKNWWYALGGTPLILLGIQIVTGILLTFYYEASPERAWQSVQRIQDAVPFGWWIRSVHHWTANLMIVAVALHAIRVFFTGAYRKPRELNWMVGVALLGVTLGFAFTGYALVYDQLSYWAATVGTNVAAQLPLVGPWIAALLRGGATVTPTTLTRLYVLHVGAMPAFALVLIGVHVFLLRIHGVMELDAPKEVQERPITVEEDREGKKRFDPNRYFAFFPDHVTTELIVGLVLVTAVTMLAMIFPAHLGEPANPQETPLHIKPEWYFYPAFKWLKIAPLWLGMTGIIVAGLGILFWPFIDGAIRRRKPELEIAPWVGGAFLITVIVLLIWEALS
jgi:quinol-cytochrome oxidoreductase complex cytochrome b subunit